MYVNIAYIHISSVPGGKPRCTPARSPREQSRRRSWRPHPHWAELQKKRKKEKKEGLLGSDKGLDRLSPSVTDIVIYKPIRIALYSRRRSWRLYPHWAALKIETNEGRLGLGLPQLALGYP